jgi:AbrB family looped-hinge helix DNA binding protein
MKALENQPPLTSMARHPKYYLAQEGITVMATTITSKGQVTIPKPVRERLNLKPGNAVEFELAEDGRVVLVKAGRKTKPRQSPFERIRGSATVPITTEELMALTRGDD